MDLNVADVFIILTILISTAIGIYRGFIREFLTIVTWIVASFVAYLYGKDLGEQMFFLDDPYAKEIFGMVAVFLGVVFIGFLLKVIICKIAKITGVSKVDRVTGALFGALRGCIIIVLVLYVSSKNITNQEWYKKSKFLPRFNKAASMLPKAWEEEVTKEVNDLMTKTQAPAPVTTAAPVTSTPADAAATTAPVATTPATPTTVETPAAPNVTPAATKTKPTKEKKN